VSTQTYDITGQTDVEVERIPGIFQPEPAQSTVTEDELLEEARDVETLAREGSIEIARNANPDWPRTRLRINFTKNTKGFNYELTGEVDGVFSPAALADTWDRTCIHGVQLIRKGLDRLEAMERGETDQVASQVAAQVATSPNSADSIDEVPW
jgi:hypothetical protein